MESELACIDEIIIGSLTGKHGDAFASADEVQDAKEHNARSVSLLVE